MINFIPRRHGVSTILGATIFISILLTGFGLVAWNAVVYDSYIQGVNSRELLYLQRVSENVTVTGFKFNQNKLNLTMSNLSPLTVRIVRLWVTNVSANPQWHRTFDVNYYLTPGRSTSNVGQSLGTFKSTFLYTVKLVTSRGNVFGATNFLQTSVVGIAQGMGWLTIDWDSYFYTDNTLCSGNNCSWKTAWNISATPTSGQIQFRINVTNHWDRNLTILKYTYLRLETDQGATGNAFPYYIMGPGSVPPSPVCYTGPGTPIVVAYNKTGDFQTGGNAVTLQFMDVGYYPGSCSVPTNKPQHEHYYSVYLVVYYSYTAGSSTYVMAQTIPFEATGYPED